MFFSFFRLTFGYVLPSGTKVFYTKRLPSFPTQRTRARISRVTTLLHSCLTAAAFVGIQNLWIPWRCNVRLLRRSLLKTCIIVLLPPVLFGAQLRDVFESYRTCMRLSSAGCFLSAFLYVYLFPSKPFSMFHSINGDSKSVKTSAFRFFIYF